MSRLLRHTAVLAAGLLLLTSACGAQEGRQRSTVGADSAGTVAEPDTAPGAPRIEHDDVSFALPHGWHGRVLPLDYPAAVLQAANFEFAPVGVELPMGEEDPIKAMTAEHALVMVVPCGIASYEDPPRPAPARVSLDDLSFLPKGHSRVPAGHAFAQGSFDFSGRCLRIEADFGGAPPDPALAAEVDGALGSLVVGPGVMRAGTTETPDG